MIIELAWKLRQYHKDFLDCLIIASARLTTNTLVTEDSIILDSISKNPILGMIEEKNDSFTCETS